MAFTFDDLDSLLDRYQELGRARIRPVAPVQHGPTTSLYYRDPDGNHVELLIDNFATPEEVTAYLEGPEVDADPIGPGLRCRADGGRSQGRRGACRTDHPGVGTRSALDASPTRNARRRAR